MKIRLAWIRVTAVAAFATIGGPWTAAQSPYAPYPTTQPTTASQPYPTTMPSQNVPPASAERYATTAGTPYAQTPYQAPRYQQPAATSPYVSLARQMDGTSVPGMSAGPQTGSLPAPTPAMNGAAPQGNMQGYNAPTPYPTTDAMSGYMSSDPGYGNGNCGCQEYGYGYDACLEECGGSQWFGGVYGLYMTRSTPEYRPFTAGIDSAATGTPYFPQASDVENQSDCAFLAPHWQGGLEIRLGCTFAIGDGCDYGDSCGDCGTCNSGCNTGCGCDNACGCQPCAPCCQQMFAWEIAWWGLEDDQREQFVDGPVVGTFRYYGMINYAGLQYDDGGGVQPVNVFYNYQIPVTGTGTETVLAQRVRTNFSVQNFELNFMRLPLYMGGCGCDCQPFTITSMCGVRYFRIDDDFEFGTEWDDGSGTFDGWRNGPNELFHTIDVENNLVGLQFGANMNYCVATRWNFFWDTNFGVYNNFINQQQRMYNPLNGDANFIQDGRAANANSDKDSVAFLGEIRVGGGYSFTNHWRGILAYRAIGLSGIATSQDQIKAQYTNYSDFSRINNDGSLIIHGLQAGVECVY